MRVMKQPISRKHFIRNLGVLTAGVWKAPGMAYNASPGGSETYAAGDFQRSWPNEDTTRGSWVREGTPGPDDVRLVGADGKCQIIIAADSHTAVRQAAVFLASDIESLTGQRPDIGHRPLSGMSHLYLIQQGDSSFRVPFDVSDLHGKWESYRIGTVGSDVWLVGSDFRGTAFAAYCLSERLGIDPLHWWTGCRPSAHASLVMKKTFYDVPTPIFKYRGFFHDDEDILPRPFEMSGYPLRTGDVSLIWYQRFFETALRLGMNLVAPYTRVHRREEVQRCASDWGLFYTSHHYDVLLSNPFGIERFNLAEKRGVDPTWDWFTNKAGMQGYWRGGVEENKDLYTIWPVGLRGTDDHAYGFAPGTSERAEAAVFGEVINWQIDTVKKMLPPGREAIFHFTLYTEMLDRYLKDPGAFDLPEDVIIVWPDDNDGLMRALPRETGKWKHGVYYHLAYFGGEKSKQVTHIVSPYRITAELNKIIQAKATELLLVNVSEMRAHVMEARLIAEISWKGIRSDSTVLPAERYIRWWIAEYFGTPASEHAFAAYLQYYRLLDTADKVWNGGTAVHSLLKMLTDKFKGLKYSQPDTDWLSALRQRDSAYQEAFRSISKATDQMGRGPSRFFFEHVTLGLLLDSCPVACALRLSKALTEPDTIKAWREVTAAMESLVRLEDAIRTAEHPPFEQWYRESWIRKRFSRYNVHYAFELMRAFITAEGLSLPSPPSSTGHAIAQAKIWTCFLDATEDLDSPMSKDWL